MCVAVPCRWHHCCYAHPTPNLFPQHGPFPAGGDVAVRRPDRPGCVLEADDNVAKLIVTALLAAHHGPLRTAAFFEPPAPRRRVAPTLVVVSPKVVTAWAAALRQAGRLAVMVFHGVKRPRWDTPPGVKVWPHQGVRTPLAVQRVFHHDVVVASYTAVQAPDWKPSTSCVRPSPGLTQWLTRVGAAPAPKQPPPEDRPPASSPPRSCLHSLEWRRVVVVAGSLFNAQRGACKGGAALRAVSTLPVRGCGSRLAFVDGRVATKELPAERALEFVYGDMDWVDAHDADVLTATECDSTHNWAAGAPTE